MRRTLASILVTLLFVGAFDVGSVAQTTAPWEGTWEVNVSKSTYDPGPAPKSNRIVLKATADGASLVTDGIGADGKPTHNEIIYRFDGKDYPFKGTVAAGTTRAYTRIDDRTYEYVTKVNGKVTTTSRVVTAADGKSRTQTTTGLTLRAEGSTT
ncbi:MAG: hypothetical protein AB7N65_04350 [Vicinamibacterales bacterium]